MNINTGHMNVLMSNPVSVTKKAGFVWMCGGCGVFVMGHIYDILPVSFIPPCHIVLRAALVVVTP